MAVLDDKITAKALAAAKTLNGLARVAAVYVFGSQAEGRADEWSDIDIAAFMEGVEDWDLQKRAKAMALVMNEVGYDVEAHLFSISSLDHPQAGSFAEYIIKHGVEVMK